MVKILIPIEEDLGRESKPFMHLGNAPFYYLVDSKDENLDIAIKNESKPFGGNISPIKFVVDINSDVLLSMESCKSAIKLLDKNNTKVYLTGDHKVSVLLEQYKNNELEQYTVEMADLLDKFV
jgi:predicted Fe-Mo cluster-binding NifX family protein